MSGGLGGSEEAYSDTPFNYKNKKQNRGLYKCAFPKDP